MTLHTPHAAVVKRVRLHRLVAVFACTVAAALLLSSGRAWASHVECGDEITADTTLDSDLVNCPNNGIVIGADDITLDLAGHRIDGDGDGCDPEVCDDGIANAGHDGVTIKDGLVQEFDSGIVVGEAHGNRVLGITSRRQFFFGALLFGSARQPDPRRHLQPQHPSGGRRNRPVRLSPHPDRRQRDR